MSKIKYATQDDVRVVQKEMKATQKDIRALYEEMRETKQELKDEMLDLKVEILGELKKMREDDEAHKFSHMRINDELQEHDQRLKNLEIVKN